MVAGDAVGTVPPTVTQVETVHLYYIWALALGERCGSSPQEPSINIITALKLRLATSIWLVLLY